MLIEETAVKAPRGLDKFEPHIPRSPIKGDIIFTTPEPAKFGSHMPRSIRIDDRTVSYTAGDYLKTVWTHMSLVMLGALHTFPQDPEKLCKLLPERARKNFNNEYEERMHKWGRQPSPYPPPELD